MDRLRRTFAILFHLQLGMTRNVGARRVLASLLAVGLLLTPVAQAKTIALLVGIGQYPNPDNRLTGPAFDVAAMKAAVTTHFGARPEDVVTLLDAQATRAAILEALKALSKRSAPGDQVIIYFSGHGTSARDRKNDFDLPYGTGAFVPYDATQLEDKPLSQRLIIGRSDLGPLALRPLDEGGRSVLVIVDACYSGKFVRNVSKGKDRYVALGAGSDEFATPTNAAPAPETTPYPYRNVVMLSASGDYEAAKETTDPAETFDGKPQGVFTDALIRIFRGTVSADSNRDGEVSFQEIRAAARGAIAAAGYPQSPQLLPALEEDRSGLTLRGVPGIVAKPIAQVGASAPTVTVAPNAQSVTEALAQSGVKIVPKAGEFVFDRAGDDYRLLTSSGDLIFANPSFDRVVDRLQAEIVLRRIVAGADPKLAPQIDTSPGHRAGTFLIGQDGFQVIARVKPGARLMLIDFQPFGRITTLYPTRSGELTPAADDGILRVPENGRILATPPEGLDRVLALEFPKSVDGISEFFELNSAPTSKTIIALETWLRGVRGGYGSTITDIRVANPGGRP